MPVANESPDTCQQLSDKHSSLQKQFNAGRLKAGELQIQISKLRNRIGQDNDNTSLYKQIDQLTEKTKNFEIQLANALDPAHSNELILAMGLEKDSSPKFGLGWKNYSFTC